MEMIKPKKIIKSQRKTLSLQINEDGELIVRVPKFVSDNVINEFIEKNSAWIIKKIKEIQSKKSQVKVHSFEDGEEYLFLGKKLKLKIIDEFFPLSKKLPSITINEDFITVREKDPGKIASLIQKFYKSEARKILQERVNLYLNQLNQIYNFNLNYRKIQLTNGRKSLGSCSPKGDLNFSWRIIQAPLEVIDYIVIHELIHLKIKNHKRFFWLRVGRLQPDYRKSIEWLKENWFYLRDFLR